MRLVDIEYFFRGARRDEIFQDLSATVFPFLDLRDKFSVGESAGSAFAEQGIGLGVQGPRSPEKSHIARWMRLVVPGMANGLVVSSRLALEAKRCQGWGARRNQKAANSAVTTA